MLHLVSYEHAAKPRDLCLTCKPLLFVFARLADTIFAHMAMGILLLNVLYMYGMSCYKHAVYKCTNPMSCLSVATGFAHAAEASSSQFAHLTVQTCIRIYSAIAERSLAFLNVP